MNIDEIKAIIPFDYSLIIDGCSALIIFIAGWIIAGFFRRKIRRSTLTNTVVSDTLRPILASVVYYFILITALYAALDKIGVTSSTLLAAFGAAGLAIALALKDTLANIAAGIMLLFVRSLQVGDYVELPGSAGTIEEIGLFSTTLRDSQGIAVYVPNNIIWSNRVQNFNRHGARRAIINIIVSYDTNLKHAQKLLNQVLQSAEDVKTIPATPEVYVTDFAARGVILSCRLWLPGDNWLARTSELRVDIKTALDKAGIKMPVNLYAP